MLYCMEEKKVAWDNNNYTILVSVSVCVVQRRGGVPQVGKWLAWNHLVRSLRFGFKGEACGLLLWSLCCSTRWNSTYRGSV